MSIATILNNYSKIDSMYNIQQDMGVILEYISYLESQIERRTEHEND